MFAHIAVFSNTLLYYSSYSNRSDSLRVKIAVMLVFGVVVGIGFFIKGLKSHFRVRLIENIPTSTARSVAVGLVEVAGRAREFGEILTAPFSQNPCVYYQFKVQEKRRSRRSSRWVTVAKEQSPDLFFVVDNTGQILVNPMGALLDMDVDHTFSSSWVSGGMPETVESKLNEMGYGTSSWLGFSKEMRIAEIFLAPGDRVYVMGTAVPVANKITAAASSGLVIRQAVSDKILYISDKQEKELLVCLRRGMLAGIYGGALLSVVCAAMLVQAYLMRGGFPFSF